tara:strand:- start:105 stop:557 length:453 start_codon:yes stop_codon:yes gene_type:complete
MIKKIKIIILGFFLIFSQSTVNSESNHPVFKQIVCSINVNKNNSQELSLDIADNEQKRSYGLMNREYMKPNSGMLFIWKDSQIRSFWMKNTHFNLDLFFFNNNGEIIEIYKNARAFDKTNIKSKEKVKYVLEMNAGEQNFKIGNKLICNF